MKKLAVVFVAALFAAISAVPAMAGPSRAIIQEMGSTIGKDEVNIDLDWSGQAVAGGQANVGNATNLGVGGIALSSVNVGLADGLELRLGRTPGFRNYLNLPNVGNADLTGSTNPLGVTVKGTIPGVSGLAAYVAYGSIKDDTVAGTTNAEGSSTTIGAAYTWAGPVIVNADVNYTTRNVAGVAAGDDTTTAIAAAVVYPLKSNVLLGAELHYATVDAKNAVFGDVKTTVLAEAIGARVLAGNWTIDAIALLNTNVDTDISGTETAKTTVVGVPTLRVNYKF